MTSQKQTESYITRTVVPVQTQQVRLSVPHTTNLKGRTCQSDSIGDGADKFSNNEKRYRNED